MDTSLAIAIVAFAAGSIAVFLIWLKVIFWDFLKDQKTGTIMSASLKDILLIVLLFPIYFTGLIGAVWLYYQGWEGFAHTVTFSAEASFGFGFFLAFVYVIANIGGRRMAKDRDA